jgi:hypothetical protein
MLSVKHSFTFTSARSARLEFKCLITWSPGYRYGSRSW